EPVPGLKMLLQNGRGGRKFVQARFNHVLPNGADCVALLGHALEMDLIAGADEIPVAPADPAHDFGQSLAHRPEIGFGQLRKPAGDGVRLPQRPLALDQDGDAEVRVEPDEFLALPGRERRGEFEFDRRIEEAGNRDREARIVVAAEIELHGALLTRKIMQLCEATANWSAAPGSAGGNLAASSALGNCRRLSASRRNGTPMRP